MALEGSHASGRFRGEINITPMIDILLVLLVIFMVIAPAVPRGLQAALPQRSMNPNQGPESPLIVEVAGAPDGRVSYKINQDSVSADRLATRLSSILSARAGKVIFVKADDHLTFSAIATVFDIAKGAGADHIGLLTSKDAL